MQTCCLQQHAASTVHRVAQAAYLAPDKPIQECLPYTLREQDLFRGNVPQPLDWLRAWQGCRTPASHLAAVSFYATEAYAVGRACSVNRRCALAPLRHDIAIATNQLVSLELPNLPGLHQMIMVMHWAVKMKRLEKLKECQAISISVDDRKDYRLLRYRSSSLPKAQSPHNPSSLQGWCDVRPLVHEGILGVFRTGQDVAENTLESHDEDKSKAMAQSIEVMLRRACEDAEAVVDEAALQHVLSHVKHFASDQGPSVGKCGKLLASSRSFPNLSYVSFDPGHQVRIAMKDPLEALPEFQQQWERLFGGKDALLPTIQNSDAWRAKLIAAQKKVLEVHQTQSGVDKALKTFSFAPQRFDTSASPLLIYCCLIRAIAVLCGAQAADAPRPRPLDLFRPTYEVIRSS